MWWAVQVLDDILIANMVLMVNIPKESQVKEKVINEANEMKRQWYSLYKHIIMMNSESQAK